MAISISTPKRRKMQLHCVHDQVWPILFIIKARDNLRIANYWGHNSLPITLMFMLVGHIIYHELKLHQLWLTICILWLTLDIPIMWLTIHIITYENNMQPRCTRFFNLRERETPSLGLAWMKGASPWSYPQTHEIIFTSAIFSCFHV